MPGRGWRVLAAAVGFVASLIVAPATGLGAQTTGDCVGAASWPAARADLAAAALTAVNAHRVSLGLAPLAPSAALTSSAEWKARHMAAYGYMAHDDPAPPLARSLWERIAACGYGGPAGENVARWYPTGAAAVAAWLADPPHRANLEGAWMTTGVGAAVAANGVVYWVEDFGLGAVRPPPPPPPIPRAAAVCTVPRVARLTVATALQRLHASHCGARVVRAETSRVRVGRIAWQSPRAGVRLPAGRTVVVAVSARRS